MTESRQLLLDAAIAHVAEHGVRDLTLRGLASAIGTSHRMLIYHFGSRDGLLVEVVRAVEAGTRNLYERLDAELGTQAHPADLARRFWQALTDPALHRHERLFFELYGRALAGDPGTTGLLDRIIDSWLDPMTRLFLRLGIPEAQAPVHARLGVAVARGLLLDYLATGDLPACTAAMNAFIATYDPTPNHTIHSQPELSTTSSTPPPQPPTPR